MIGAIALCVDEESLAHPEMLGLEDVRLEGLSWLHGFSQGSALRAAVTAERGFDEVWLVAAEDVLGLNLAAALRKDGFAGTICMVVNETSGSALSRAMAAGVNEVYTPDRFVQRFSVEANRRRRMDEVAAGISVPPLRTSASSTSSSLRSGNPRAAARRGTEQPSRLPAVTGNGRLIAVMGASGGVGKSTVAAAIASKAAVGGAKTLILDGDLQFGCMHRMFGVEQPVTFDDAAADGKTLESLAAAVPEGIPAVLAAPKRLEHSETLMGRVAEIAAAATRLFDVVVADTGASWSEAHAALIEMATCPLFVIDQRTESIRACQHALELCRRMGLATGSFAFALNRCSKGASFTSADVSCALDGVHVHELDDGGLEVEELCGSGIALSLPDSGNPFAKSLDELVCAVMPEVFGKPRIPAVKERGSSLFRSFGHRRGEQRRRQRKSHEIIVQAGPPHPSYASSKHAWESL